MIAATPAALPWGEVWGQDDALGQLQAAFAGRQLVQRQHQRGVAEETGGLGDLGRQLLVEPGQVVVRKLQHGDREHAALELEYGVLVE